MVIDRICIIRQENLNKDSPNRVDDIYFSFNLIDRDTVIVERFADCQDCSPSQHSSMEMAEYWDQSGNTRCLQCSRAVHYYTCNRQYGHDDGL